jgi:hypothetical protein
VLLRGGQRLSQRLEHGWQQRREALRCSTQQQDASRKCVSLHVPGRALPPIFSCCCHSYCACAACDVSLPFNSSAGLTQLPFNNSCCCQA